jgi:hypothetical protein
LHEETHAPGVYSPGTEDNGYGYSAATSLSSYDAVLNADSYALYANGMFSLFDNVTIASCPCANVCVSHLRWMLENQT